MFELLWYYIWKAIKFVVHLISRRCEIERIFHKNLSINQATARLENSILTSTKLIEAKKDIVKPKFDVEIVFQSIINTKNLHNAKQNVLTNIRVCLVDIDRVNILTAEVKSLQTQPYSTSNQEHEQKLLRLWRILVPAEQIERISRRWGHIGFQGTDPSTDFRGMGMLGLEQLLYFAEKYPTSARNSLSAANSKYEFPFAITGINLSSLMLKLLEKRSLNYMLYGKSDRDRYNDLYCMVFASFCQFYVEAKPANLLEFPVVLDKFTKNLTATLNSKQKLDFALS